MAISPQWLYLYSAHRAVIFAIAQLSCYNKDWIGLVVMNTKSALLQCRLVWHTALVLGKMLPAPNSNTARVG